MVFASCFNRVMNQRMNIYRKKIQIWLLNGVYEEKTTEDREMDALRKQMRQEFIQLRDKGLPIRIVSV